MLFIYLSLATTLLLGVVIYFQSKRINDLEVSQHSFFGGILDIDYSVDLENCIYVPNWQKGFIVSYHFADKNKGMLSSVGFLSGGQVKSVVLPLVFTTKNQQLITSIHYQSVEVALRFAGLEIVRHELESKCGPIYTSLDNERKFLLEFRMLMPADWNIDEVELHFFVDLKDQNGANRQIEIMVTLQKGSNGKGYCMVASRTIELTKIFDISNSKFRLSFVLFSNTKSIKHTVESQFPYRVSFVIESLQFLSKKAVCTP